MKAFVETEDGNFPAPITQPVVHPQIAITVALNLNCQCRIVIFLIVFNYMFFRYGIVLPNNKGVFK